MPKPNPESRLAGLKVEERELYEFVQRPHSIGTYRLDVVKAALESLARSRASDARKRALLKEIEWGSFDEKGYPMCPKCQRLPNKHAPGCALAAEMEGGE